ESIVLRGTLREPDEGARARTGRLDELLERALARVGVDLGETPVDRLDRARFFLLEEPVREDRRGLRRLLLRDDVQGPFADRSIREAREESEGMRENVLLHGARECDAWKLLDEDGDLEGLRGIAVLETLGIPGERGLRRSLLVLSKQVEAIFQRSLLEACEEVGVRGVRRPGPLDRRGLSAPVDDDLRVLAGGSPPRRPSVLGDQTP